MYRLLRFILLCYIILLTACQQQTTPTLQGTEATGSHPTDSAKLLFDRVDHYYKEVMHDSLYALAPVAMDYFERNGLWREYYTTWCLQVNDLVWNGQMDRGFDEAQKMHQDAIRRDNAFGLSEAYTAMGIAYHFQKNDAESAQCYQQALRYYPEEADQSVKLNIYSYYVQVLVDMKDQPTIKVTLSEWGDFLNKLTGGNTDDEKYAHSYFRFHRECFRYYYGIADYRQARKELDTMQMFLDREKDTELYQGQVIGFRVQLATALKDYKEAMAWSDHEIELCRKLDYNTYLNALKHRTDMLQALGHYEEALKAWQSYDAQKDSIIKADTRKQLNELNTRFEVDELKAEQERRQYEHERGLFILIISFATVVVAALVLFTLWRQRAERRLKEAHRLLEKSNEDLQQSYEQLKEANARAEESSKMKSDFIHQISHEIRTPLNVLSGFTQIITTPGMELDDEQKVDISQRITENTERITRLVNKMLELSDANSQAVINRTDQASIAQIAAKATDESRIRQASHIHFETEYCQDADTTILTTNLQQASRALAQLLDNAQKFTKSGTVSLITKTTPDIVSFVVKDTGIGIPIYEAEHIFDEFVQLDEYYDGTGIGLTVARSIARRLGGDVMLDTSYTHGACFVMMLQKNINPKAK